MNFKLLALATIVLSTFLACEKKGSSPDTDENGADLVGELIEDRTLEAGSTHNLTGGFHVKPGVTLTIEEGVTIIAKDDNIVDYILVEQGAKIDAQGTAEKPIVLTSERKEPGSWGGLHICGKSSINVTGTTSKSEIGDATYGGDDDSDNSGVLKYIRLEYTGYAFSEEKESNGFTFYGVGDGTTVEYLQSYKGSDDGFEWFGGTVNSKYLVSTDNTDDSFDWTEGWRGKGQFWIAYQISDECDCLIEADNSSMNNALTPISHPILSNITLVGNNSTRSKRGIRLRAGTQVEIYNSLVVGKAESITVETPLTETSLSDGDSKLEYIYISKGVSVKDNIYSEAKFLENPTNKINADIKFTNNFIGTIDQGVDMSISDSFFNSTNYKGAVSVDNDWTKGWTR